MVRKSNTRTYTPPEQVKVEPNIAIVKDLLADNIDGHHYKKRHIRDILGRMKKIPVILMTLL